MSSETRFSSCDEKVFYTKYKEQIDKINVESLLILVDSEIEKMIESKSYSAEIFLHNITNENGIKCINFIIAGKPDPMYNIYLNYVDPSVKGGVYRIRICCNSLEICLKFLLFKFFNARNCKYCGTILKDLSYKGDSCASCCMKKSEHEYLNKALETCSICQEEVICGYKTTCNHIFHYNCFYDLEEKIEGEDTENERCGKKCPNCRKFIEYPN